MDRGATEVSGTDLFAKARSLKEGELVKLFTTTLDALFMSGEMRVRLTGQTGVYCRAMADACADATAQPGCEVRFTVPSLGEAVFAFAVMYDALKQMGKLDEDRTRLQQIELTNGSCILVKLEEKAE